MTGRTKHREQKRDTSSQSGIALMLVLWVLTILMVIVFSFSFMARTETYATLSFKGGIERKFIAEAGIERGIMELFFRQAFKQQTVELEGLGVWKADGTPYQGQMGDGYYTVRITDESGKVDINQVSDVVLKNLFVNAGIQAETADSIVDAIMDWKDPDDLTRLHGAESDYYMSLQNPYKAKNADFDTLEELLLVKGVTSDILYGSNEKKGLIDYLTVHSKTEFININAAPRDILIAIPGMSPETADAIINYRESKEILDIHEVQGILGSNYAIMDPYIDAEDTNTYTIVASGMKNNEKGSYTIKATVLISDNKHHYLYYKSPATIK